MSYFSDEEFLCQHCGEKGIREEIVDRLNAMREDCGFPFVISSGYRCSNHPIEARKSKPGAHAAGYAADISVRNGYALAVIKSAMQNGIDRIGINQKGDGRFIHVDVDPDRPSPAVWSY